MWKIKIQTTIISPVIYRQVVHNFLNYYTDQSSQPAKLRFSNIEFVLSFSLTATFGNSTKLLLKFCRESIEATEKPMTLIVPL